MGDPTATLIGDFESGTLAQPQIGGRYGSRTAFSDMSASCTITAQSATVSTPGYNSTFAASLSGTGCTTWGAAMADFDEPLADFAPYTG